MWQVLDTFFLPAQYIYYHAYTKKLFAQIYRSNAVTSLVLDELCNRKDRESTSTQAVIKRISIIFWINNVRIELNWILNLFFFNSQEKKHLLKLCLCFISVFLFQIFTIGLVVTEKTHCINKESPYKTNKHSFISKKEKPWYLKIKTSQTAI